MFSGSCGAPCGNSAGHACAATPPKVAKNWSNSVLRWPLGRTFGNARAMNVPITGLPSGFLSGWLVSTSFWGCIATLPWTIRPTGVWKSMLVTSLHVGVAVVEHRFVVLKHACAECLVHCCCRFAFRRLRVVIVILGRDTRLVDAELANAPVRLDDER